MNSSLRILLRSLLGALLVLALPLRAEELRLAVASNFTAAFQQLAPRFEQATGHRLKPSFGSTGKLYAQIRQGAPFEILLAADDKHGRLLIESGFGVPGSEFIYAVGRLVLWSAQPELVGGSSEILASHRFRRLAIANPLTAPYGAAAIQTLEHLELYDSVRDKLVQGENIAQTLQFTYSGNAELGFIAWAQLKALPAKQQGSFWLVPEDLHEPIRQEATLLRQGEDSQAARAFLDFLQSPQTRALLKEWGYDTPEAEPR